MTATSRGTERWQLVKSFASSGEGDRHFRLDAVAGEIEFGPIVRESDGTVTPVRRHPAGRRAAAARLLPDGRRPARQRGPRPDPHPEDQRRRTSPVSRTGSPAVGGAEAETLDEAKVRGPMQLRSRGRAVTREDYEELAREVAPDIARALLRRGH